MRTLASVATALALIACGTGCSSASDLPLGGPYGGSVNGVVTDAGGSGSGAGSSTSGSLIVLGSSGGSSTTMSIATSGSSTGMTFSSSQAGTTSSTESTESSSSTAASSSATASSSSSAAAPTWTDLYTTYLSASGSTPGACDGSCHHHSQCSSASACFSWIGNGKYDLSASGNLFCWDSDGFMPTQCPSSYGNAIADFAAWIAAGSQNN